jgi:hypothetical protein
VTGLGRRLRLLEASGGGECPECGLAPGAPFELDEVLWHDTEEQDPAGPEWCSTCGRQTTFVVGWRDIEPPDPGEGDR